MRDPLPGYFSRCLGLCLLLVTGCTGVQPSPSVRHQDGITEAEYQKVSLGMHFTEVVKALGSQHLDDALSTGEGITIKGPNGEECDRVQYYRTSWAKPEERATIYYKDLKVVAKTVKVVPPRK